MFSHVIKSFKIKIKKQQWYTFSNNLQFKVGNKNKQKKEEKRSNNIGVI